MEKPPVSVSSPADFQREVNGGTKDIIIQEHLDLTGLGPADGSSDQQEILLHRATRSIRGNCTTPPPPKNLEPALEPLRDRQCVIYTSQMLMRLPYAGNRNGGPPNNLWLDNVYIRVLRASTQEAQRKTIAMLHPTAIGVTLYLTKSTIQGDGGQARALGVKDGALVYAEDSSFLDLYTVDGPGIAISNGAVALRACRFARCDAAGSAVVDVAKERLRMESTVFEDNGGSRAVSVDTVEGEVFASPQLQVYDEALDQPWPSKPLSDIPSTTIFPDSSDEFYRQVTQELRAYDLSVEGPRQPSAAAVGPPASPAPAPPATTMPPAAALSPPQMPAPESSSGSSNVTLAVAVVLAALLAAALTALAFFVARHRRSRRDHLSLKASVTELDDISHENDSHGPHHPTSPPEAIPQSRGKMSRSGSRSATRTATRSSQYSSSFGTATSPKPSPDPVAVAHPDAAGATKLPSPRPPAASPAPAAGTLSQAPSGSDLGTAATGPLPQQSPWSSLSSATNPANRAAAAAAVAAAAVAQHPAAVAATSPERSTRASGGTPTASAHGYAVAPVLAYSQATPPTSGQPPLSLPSDPSIDPLRGEGRPLPVLSGSALAASATGQSSSGSWDIADGSAPQPMSPTERRAHIQQPHAPLHAQPPRRTDGPVPQVPHRIQHAGVPALPMHSPHPPMPVPGTMPPNAMQAPGALSLAELLPRYPPGHHPGSAANTGGLGLATDPYARLAGGLQLMPGDPLAGGVPLKAPIKPPPSPESHGHKHPLDVLEDALDWMSASGRPFLGQYTVLPASERRRGGQGVVQFVRSRASGEEFAVKFYAARTSFERERALYMDASLRSMMPATRAFIGNYNGAVSGPNGYVFPPCIIIERGESLKEWAKRESATDFITNMQVLIHVATRLQLLHAAGWVHRDIKPGNILRRPRQHSWTLIDFGSTVREGAAVGLSYSLAYAPPEVVHAIEAAAPTLVASAAVDMWALGVIAFELLTQHHPFPPKATRASVRSQIAGRESLPWECKTDPQCARDLEMLRGLRRTVLKCLDRNPEKRPTAEALLSKWNHMFDQITSELTATGPVPGALAVPSVVPSPAAEAAAAAAAEAEAAEAVGPTAVASDAEAELAIAEAVARTSTPPPLLASPPQTVRPAAAPAADSSGGDDGAVVSPRPPLAESPSPRPQGESSGLAAASATMAALLTPAPSDGATPSSSASPSLVAPVTSAADVSHADGSEPAAPTTVQMKSSHDEERGQ